MALPEKRWVQRFDNYLSVLQHLENFVAIKKERELSVAENFAIIKAFELTFECAWNVLKDYLKEKGNSEIYGSRDAVRNAFRVGIIQNGDIWFDMIKNRNNTAHAYDEESAEDISFDVSEKYMEEFGNLKTNFEKRRNED